MTSAYRTSSEEPIVDRSDRSGKRDRMFSGTEESPEAASIDDEAVRSLPPSSKLVLMVLREEGPLTQRQLTQRTRLAQRTVRGAASRLVDLGIIEERPYFPDARQTAYRLAALGR